MWIINTASAEAVCSCKRRNGKRHRKRSLKLTLWYNLTEASICIITCVYLSTNYLQDLLRRLNVKYFLAEIEIVYFI